MSLHSVNAGPTLYVSPTPLPVKYLEESLPNHSFVWFLTFYFERIVDLEEVANIVQRNLVYPFSSFLQ